jgi:copper(I)-binding protein
MMATTRNARAFALGLLLLAPASAGVAVAAAPAQCLPRFENGWVRAAPPGATVLSGYGTLRNDCAAAAVLKGALSPDFVMAQVHETKVENGVSRMRLARTSPLPARATLRFEPNGRHLMLMHPRKALPVGKTVKLEFVLADGRRIPAELTVLREAPAQN